MNFIILIAGLLSTSVYAVETMGRIVGQLGIVEGEVLVDSKAVKKNSPVREGSVVEVKNGKATLLLGSGSVFHLAANSKMVVKQFGMREDTKKEGGDVDLNFGRTRALILNKGSETKDVRIITRTATMGVRGTEIFIDSPKDISKPVQFFTLEGSAKLDMPKSPSVEVKQNQGVSSQGTLTMSVNEVKATIKESMQVVAINTSADMGKLKGEYSHDADMNIPFPRFDPILDRLTPVSIVPHFCNATGTGSCP